MVQDTPQEVREKLESGDTQTELPTFGKQEVEQDPEALAEEPEEVEGEVEEPPEEEDPELVRLRMERDQAVKEASDWKNRASQEADRVNLQTEMRRIRQQVDLLNAQQQGDEEVVQRVQEEHARQRTVWDSEDRQKVRAPVEAALAKAMGEMGVEVSRSTMENDPRFKAVTRWYDRAHPHDPIADIGFYTSYLGATRDAIDDMLDRFQDTQAREKVRRTRRSEEQRKARERGDLNLAGPEGAGESPRSVEALLKVDVSDMTTGELTEYQKELEAAQRRERQE